MSWVRLEDSFTNNPKIVELSDRDFRTWVRLLCYCGQAKDPTVDNKTRREVAGLTPSRVSRFVSLHLLDENGANPGVFEVHDWSKYQPKDGTGSERQARWRSRKRQLSTVIPTVTPAPTEIVTPSRAGVTVPSRPEGLSSEEKDKGLTEASYEGNGLSQFPVPETARAH